MPKTNEFQIETHGRDVACNVSKEKQSNLQSVSTTTVTSKKFKNKYRIQSARLPGFDYSSNGAYFITICTKNREHFFGEIIDGKMQLSEMGEIAKDCWEQIPQHFPFVQLGAFVIMPNHVHGIIVVDKTDVETLHATSLPLQRDELYKGSHDIFSQLSPQKYSVGSIIRSYKSAVSKNIHEFSPNFTWQSRFHDHIIRNEKEFTKISEYIMHNPQNWKEDCYF
jgi:REP element-mobilizing transposase RayT